MEKKKVLMKSNVAASNLLRTLHSLYQLGHFCDVTIHTDQPGMQEEFFVHKAVLAASSNYFKSLFLSDEMLNAKNCKITLQDVHAEEFVSFLKFVYTTEVEIEVDRLQRIKEVAERLECKDLLDVFEEMKNAGANSDLSVHLKRRKNGGSPWSQIEQTEDKEQSDPSHILSVPMKRNLWDRKKHTKLSASSDANEGKPFTPEPEFSPEGVSLVKSEDETAASTRHNKAGLLKSHTTNDTGKEENKANHPSPNVMDSKDTLIVISRVVPDQKGVLDETKVRKSPRNISKVLPQSYVCDKCHSSFHFARQYQSHMELEHDTHLVIKYSCNACDQLFSSCQNLRQHRLTVHSSEQCFPCLLCDKKFKQQKDINDHIRKVHEKKQNPQRCPYCDKVISSKCGLTVHIRTHTGEKPYKCECCPASFAQRSAFNTHVRSHTGEKPYVCEECGACFVDKGKLNSHKRTHTGERLFRCDVCGKHFSSNEYLKCHKRCHMGAKPYKCDVCGKTFGLRASLAQHSNVHAETPPYFCEQCGKTFTQQGALRRHQRIHTGEKPYKCRACERTFTDMSTLRRHVLVHDRNAHWRSFLIDLTIKKDHNWSKIETLSNICVRDNSTPVWSGGHNKLYKPENTSVKKAEHVSCNSSIRSPDHSLTYL